MQEDDLDVAPQMIVPGVERQAWRSLEQIVAQLTPEQLEEVLDFAEFLLERRSRRLSSSLTSRAGGETSQGEWRNSVDR